MSKALTTKSKKNKPKKNHSLIAISLACLFAVPGAAMAEPQSLQQKASYSVGINFAKSLKTQGIDLDTDSLMQGMKDGLSGSKPALTQAEMTKALNEFKAQIVKQQQQTQQEQLSKNKQLGADFLAENKNKEGVQTLESGLQYKVIKSGDGPSPKLSDKVTTHYRGTLIDGTEFDSSYSRNKPSSFPVKGVIPGWTEALQLMHVGDKWQLFIPSELAYDIGVFIYCFAIFH